MNKERETVAAATNNENRTKVIVKTSLVGILTNILLAGLKAIVGIAASSLALILDGVNNLTDAFSSVITIIGTKLAGKYPDKKHPYGYGRIEYMSQLIVSAIVLYAGITALVESVKNVLNLSKPDYSWITLILIVLAVFAKILLGYYVKNKGKEVNSGALIASGTDATSDAALSASVLVAALLFMLTGINIEAYVGILIAIFIIKSGIELIMDALDEILGQRVEADLTAKVKDVVMTFESVHGVYDVFLNNYGPDQFVGSLHIELDDSTPANEIDWLTREITEMVFVKTGVLLTAVGIYAMNNSNEKTTNMWSNIQKITASHDGVVQTHGFYFDKKRNSITFDIIIDYATPNREKLLETIKKEVETAYPDYKIFITKDFDISD